MKCLRRRVSGVATGAHVDERQSLTTEPLECELHQGAGVPSTSMGRVHSDHLDDPLRLVIVFRVVPRDDARR
ncbi:hypothetical protein ASD62_17680 [Phycicoccus sp. Root563]|uniref:hypothetical protein n=1 Tax=Phycicoccus sp. Root563 TaxID=1736562 RepID=UPI00070385E3|nr:hypothetical protein [Phycicoccus sp. Root563]KQZ87416.1 hypothetical protein ASD62_17680 [Phycicoccus sp. Root563]